MHIYIFPKSTVWANFMTELRSWTMIQAIRMLIGTTIIFLGHYSLIFNLEYLRIYLLTYPFQIKKVTNSIKIQYIVQKMYSL